MTTVSDNKFCRERNNAVNTVFIFSLVLATMLYGKMRELDPKLAIRPVAIRNIAYGAGGTVFAVPNFVSAGSVALFQVTQQSTIATVPSRLSEKNFSRSSGLFYLRKKNENDPYMAFISLPELLSGYSADFSVSGNLLAIAGGSQVTIYDGTAKWEKTKTLTVGDAVSRAVFSPDAKHLGVIADGRLFMFTTDNYAVAYTVEPAAGCTFCDLTFSSDNSRVAVYEFRTVMLDSGARIRVFSSDNGTHDRDLPGFPTRPSAEPVLNLPLLSYSAGDSLIAATVPAAFSGKVYLVKSNDGTVFREYKGYCHAFSPDGTMFVAEGAVFSTRDWTVIGKIPRSTTCCVFSPTERVIVCATQDAIRRFRIEE